MFEFIASTTALILELIVSVKDKRASSRGSLASGMSDTVPGETDAMGLVVPKTLEVSVGMFISYSMGNQILDDLEIINP